MNTTNTTVTVTNLEACEMYIFTVGIVGPYGIGNISSYSPTVMTSLNNKAAPKKLTVTEDPTDHLAMLIQWSASCPTLTEPIGYIVSSIKLQNISQISNFYF